MRRGSGEGGVARKLGKFGLIEFRLQKRLCPPEHFALHPHLVYPPRAPCSQPTWTPFHKTNALYWQNMAKKNLVSCTCFPQFHSHHMASRLVASFPLPGP